MADLYRRPSRDEIAARVTAEPPRAPEPPTPAGKYMTPAEFAGLGSDAHHAVWRAAAEGRIDAAPWSQGQRGGHRVYNRAQVRKLLADAAGNGKTTGSGRG